MYINLISGQHIPDDSVIKESNDGLLYFEGDSWKYLSKGEYQTLEEDSEYVTKQAGKYTYASLPVDKMVPADSTNTKTYRYYTTYFGLNDLVIGDKKFHETSGVVTDEIPVKVGVPLKLKANITKRPNTSVEFSILDGMDDNPILPNDETEVEDEKLFFNCGTRMTGTDKKYRKDFKPVGKSINDDDFLDGSVLTVSYTPDESYRTYVPWSDKVKVKVIIRIYKEGALTPEISNITLTQEV